MPASGFRFAFAAGALLVVAQTSSSETISGRVTSGQGQPVPAQIQITNVLGEGCPESNTTGVLAASDGTFSFEGPPSIYSVKTRFGGSTINPDFRKVDTRSGSVTGMVIALRAGPWSYGKGLPPLASRVSVGEPDGAGRATVKGNAGAMPPGALVAIVTLETGHHATTIADATGAFETALFAPRGSHLSMKYDEIGLDWQRMRGGPGCGPTWGSMPGTIVLAAPPIQRSGVSFETASAWELPLWQFDGAIDAQRYERGEQIQVEGTIVVHAKSLATTMPRRAVLHTHLEAVYVPGTVGTRFSTLLTSHLMTPTGLPIERLRPLHRREPKHDIVTEVELTMNGMDRASGSVSLRFPIPQDLPDGIYRLSIEPDRTIPRTVGEHDVFSVDFKRLPGVRLPMFHVGTPPPPRVPLALLMDHFSNATQGIRAREDRSSFGIASRMATQSDTFVVPRLHPVSGELLTYRLEPFLPSVSLSDRDPPEIPMIPFELPSGELRVTVTQPNGERTVIGPAPLLQAWPATIINRHGGTFDGGGGHITEAYRLTTLDPRFNVSFTGDGVHEIRVELSVFDEMGTRWIGEGTFDLTVATPLSLDTTILPGTPFEVGDTMAIAGEVLPPRAAGIEAIVTIGSRTIIRRGRANAFGCFRLEPVPLTETGEYRIDITATDTGPEGAMMAGARTWGSVVAPRETTIIAHGARGTDGPGDARPQWFFHSALQSTTNDHVPFPFLAGDVSWVSRGHSSIPALSFQDLGGSVVSLLRSREENPFWIDQAAAEGEIPFFSSRADGRDVHLDPSRIDVWSYAYTSSQRPLVRVREEIGELQLQGGYWRFGEQYAAQMGIGGAGDLPNDFKFQFGGAVIRGSAVPMPRYAVYGSLWVLVPDGDPGGGTRTFPPFQGNGGGPSGGPLFKLKGEEIDLFFHPTGVRPGTVLERGGVATFAGYVAPPLPARIEAVITSPSGTTRTINGIANRVGWFYDPALDFSVTEPGVWRVKATVRFDGQTSAGQVEPPYPAGDILGSRDGEFFFYVADLTPQLQISGVPRFVEAGNDRVTFTLSPPTPLSDVTLCRTATMPGWILDEGCAPSLTWTYDPASLRRDFPNLDGHDPDGSGGADAVLVSFFVSGTDASGKVRHFSRRVLLTAGELHAPEQDVERRRRPVRRTS